ncbi:hypothetical protein LIER_26930 [Lithospermum erythrorhizon]|uniref:Uncharacterized protein n=1 Tax=Lithospermum erythrorhizon TaxID=34254 RepID=A0AAV3RDD5_LITER
MGKSQREKRRFSGTSILGATKSTVDKDTDVVYVEDPDDEFIGSNNFNYTIVVVGEHPYTEAAGDSDTLTIAHSKA